MKKVIECWYDVETTGLKVKDGAAVVQIAFLIVEDGKVVKELSSTINPFSYNRPITISAEAMNINGFLEEDFNTMPGLSNVLGELMDFCTKTYPKNKLTLIGYNNSTFDKYFLEDMFEDQGKSFGYTLTGNKLIYLRQLSTYNLVVLWVILIIKS